MSAPIFVDTNVFIYAHQANEPIKQPLAVQWLERLWYEQLGRTSLEVLNELYVVLTRNIKPVVPPAEAWDDIRNLFTWNPHPTDTELLLRAREIEHRYRLSWWDSLIVGAAQLQNCAVLLTEGLQDGAVYGAVTVRNPFTMSVSEEATPYVVTRSISSSHPRRGRPKRAASK